MFFECFFNILANLRLKVVIKKSVDGMTSLHNGQLDYVSSKIFVTFILEGGLARLAEILVARAKIS